MAWCLLVAACSAAAQAVLPAQRESAVKAAFLYRFAGFVEWPAGVFKGDEPLAIGVLNNEAVASDLEQIVAGRNVEGRRVAVRRLREGEALTGVHILFVGGATPARLRDVAASAAGPVLVVGEQDGGLRSGAVLNFQQDEGRVRFSASLTAAEARGLRMSARLLAVAVVVEGRAR